jgi:hypothetical protein
MSTWSITGVELTWLAVSAGVVGFGIAILVGCIVGAASCLWLAASIGGSTREFVREL